MMPLLRRALAMPLMMLGISFVVFLAIHALPGDPARLLSGPQVPENVVQGLRHRLGLDLPFSAQYMHFLRRALQGDFGVSLRDGTPVSALIVQRLPYSLTLGGLAYLVALSFGIPGGIIAAVCAGKWPDTALMAVTLVGASLAGFWVALIGMEVFAVRLHWLPLMGAGSWKHYVLPVFVLALMPSALILRMTRTGMREILRQDYIRTAYAKGLPSWKILTVHALPNALAPVVTVVALNLGGLVSSAVVTETVFDWPGVARLLVDSVRYRDYPVIQGITLLAVLGVLVATLVADTVNLLLDPQHRTS
ncbi:ABC transporter permease [Gluconobacter kondonii]|uniref:Glutathione ABC transporter permease n=1 Tax=Gluconobacter kondonii TaxID=941463 RepID=A0ABQ5WU55_9PROT|nr:ABC transporter permease [Gluconobacter kondonii]MCP1237689.1 ABC transporter permease [Gluconobacter kondonii]GBR29980.1 dipeptide/oligopeptide/nickel ABC transporter permease [Gluconobacter kondonii NBRC 3266]GLQ66628.1 glutathione ABC transporter permease [Gluconobacter kondonii]